MIYLDHNATTPIDPRVAQAIAECHAEQYANPASPHAAGRVARQRLEQSRESVARWLGADTSHIDSPEVIFTSGGTEANNLALIGLAGHSKRNPDDPPPRILVSSVEHPSVMGPARYLADSGFDVRQIPVDANGVVKLEQLASQLSAETRLVSVMLANNETGVIQPIVAVVSLCRQKGILVHTDAVQAVGKIPVNFDAMGVDAMTVTGHKFHGPRGIGALVVRRGLRLKPLFHGGFQQQGMRPGTESVALSVGLDTALQCADAELDDRRWRMESLRDRFERQLHDIDRQVYVVGGEANRLPHTSNVSFTGLDRQAILLALDQKGLCCSTGSACASGSSEPSPVLQAMGCSPAVIQGSLRFSLGAATSEMDIDAALLVVREILGKFRRE